MDAKEELLKLTLGKTITGLVLLIGFLLAIVWREALFGKWTQVAEGVSKPALMALLGLALIAALLEALGIAYLYLLYRSRRNIPPQSSTEPTMLKRFGVLWDKDQNPHCPVDETLMRPRVHEAARDWDVLMCPKCDRKYPLKDVDMSSLLLPAAQNLIRQGKTHTDNPMPEPKPLRRFGLLWDENQNPLCPADQTPLSFFMRHASQHFDILQCARCGNRFQIRHDLMGNLQLANAKQMIRDGFGLV